MFKDPLNKEKLLPYLANNIDGFSHLKNVKKFSIGQSNPTFLLETDTASYVIRRKPDGPLLKSAHAIDREYRVQKALYDTPVPVAKMLHYCDDQSILGVDFYIMEFVDGVVYEDPALPSLANDDRAKVYSEINRGLSSLHKVNIDAVGLTDFGADGNYYERQISRWAKQYLSSETEKINEMNEMMEELPKRIPMDNSPRSLVHGDFRLDNMIFDKNEPKIIVLNQESQNTEEKKSEDKSLDSDQTKVNDPYGLTHNPYFAYPPEYYYCLLYTSPSPRDP